MSAVIDLKDIKKTYKSGSIETKALRGVDLSVEKGEFIAIMGPSGSGKSTLMHIIGLLDTQTSGTYGLNGKAVKDLSKNRQAELRNEEIGFVFQQFNLLKRTTVLDNVLLPTIYGRAADARRRAIERIQEVGLSDYITHKSNELSVGQIQRVAIARALMMNPSILLADEPTGNLDSQTAREVMGLFTKINKKGTTVVLITHEDDIAEYAQRNVTLKDGKIINDVKA